MANIAAPGAHPGAAPAASKTQRPGHQHQQLLGDQFALQLARPASPPPVVLDGQLLLEAGGAAVPQELLTADLSSQVSWICELDVQVQLSIKREAKRS